VKFNPTFDLNTSEARSLCGLAEGQAGGKGRGDAWQLIRMVS